MKDIKPYLHLYLNAQVQVRKKNDKDREYLIGRVCEVTSGSNHGDWIKVWFDDCHTVTNDTWNELTSNAHHFFINHDEIKLILRRLSDMSEEELRELIHFEKLNREYADVSYRRDIGYNGNLIAIEIDYTIAEEDLVSPQRWRMNFSAMNADDFKFLLSKGFDLFGLIDAGLAIDAKTLTN